MAYSIEDYGLVGDGQTAALVSKYGSIDWLCMPFFDSDACLVSLLGYDKHGTWSLRPAVSVREVNQRYRGDTLILETEWICDGGRALVTDFMPPGSERSDLIRIVKGLNGVVPFQMVINPRFGYGRDRPWMTGSARVPVMTAGPDSLCLYSSAELHVGSGEVSALFDVTQGEEYSFQLAWFPSHEAPPSEFDPQEELRRTDEHWNRWARRNVYSGRYRDAVMRSLLTLKALTFEPTGAIVAAPTSSLPEEIGGVRNWDYRFCWLRDASLTLNALMFGGYVDEAARFRDWLLRAVAGDSDNMQIMYSIHGARRLTEFDVPWLPGYEGSSPVHMGNAASDQFQLDTYGEVLNAIYMGRKSGIPSDQKAWNAGMALLRRVSEIWQYPDDGIWEVRGGRRQFVHSKVMAWVAIDRGVRIIEEFGMGDGDGQAMLPRLRTLRERIHEEVCARGFNPSLNAFTQSYGSETLDASVLLIPHVGFLSAKDPRMQGTVAAIQKNLVSDGLVRRYSTEAGTDGLPGTEGAFLACSFWLADNLALSGQYEKAEEYFNRLLGLRNHLGLLAEEYEPRLSRQIGNFPQGFSHLALIITARVMEMRGEARFEPGVGFERSGSGGLSH